LLQRYRHAAVRVWYPASATKSDRQSCTSSSGLDAGSAEDPAVTADSTVAAPSSPSGEVALGRISEEVGSRRAFCQGFCRLFNLKLASLDTALARGESLAAQSIFPEQGVPFSALRVQKKRPYFLGREFTETDVGYLAFFAGMHAVAFVGGPLTFSWDAVQVAAAAYVLTGMLGVSLSYHRQLSHEAFKCPKPLEFFFAYIGALAFEGDPMEWQRGHLWHHIHSDTPADRHSPRDGLWHAQMGWLFDELLAGTRVDARGNMKDSLAPPWFYKESPGFYSWLRKTYMYHQIGQAVFFLAWGGVPYLVWGFVIRVLVTMHMTWLVNSAVHIWGSQPYRTGDESRNNWIVALLVFGDGWHNNHHAFQDSAAHGLEWYQVDFSYYLIRCMEALGLAWDVKRPSAKQMERLRAKSA